MRSSKVASKRPPRGLKAGPSEPQGAPRGLTAGPSEGFRGIWCSCRAEEANMLCHRTYTMMSIMKYCNQVWAWVLALSNTYIVLSIHSIPIWTTKLMKIPSLCYIDFQNVKLRQLRLDFVEIWSFYCHSNFSWNQILMNSNGPKMSFFAF